MTLSEMASQMEDLVHTLLIHKREDLKRWEELKASEVLHLAEWYDQVIARTQAELRTLEQRGASLGISDLPLPITGTEEEADLFSLNPSEGRL